MFKTKTLIVTIFAALLMLTVGCGDKNPASGDDHDDDFEITYTITPATVTVGTDITIDFLVEDADGEHVDGLTDTACEFEMEGMPGVEIDLVAGEHGHYSGSFSLSMTGDYEVHFQYMHDGDETHAAMTTGITCNQ